MNIKKIIEEATEEANKRYTLINQRIGFILGVEWYANKSYSKEEVFAIVNDYGDWLFNNDYPNVTFKEWFEQFKKK